MKKGLLFVSILITIVPYLTISTFLILVLSSSVSFCKYIIESIFQNNALLIILFIIFYCLLVLILTSISFIRIILKNHNPLLVAKHAMTIKLVQIPSYILIFLFGTILFANVFTALFAILFYFIDCLTIFMTGLLATSSIIVLIKKNEAKLKDNIWLIIFQYVFCIDVIASIFLYNKLKNIENKKQFSDITQSKDC